MRLFTKLPNENIIYKYISFCRHLTGHNSEERRVGGVDDPVSIGWALERSVTKPVFRLKMMAGQVIGALY